MPTAAHNSRPPAPAQLQFDWLLPDKPFLRVAEIVAATGMRTTFVEEYFADKCHRYEKTGAVRPPMRIPRAFAVELLVKSARYSSEEKVQAVCGLAREFTAAECLHIAGQFMQAADKARR